MLNLPLFLLLFSGDSFVSDFYGVADQILVFLTMKFYYNSASHLFSSLITHKYILHFLQCEALLEGLLQHGRLTFDQLVLRATSKQSEGIKRFSLSSVLTIYGLLQTRSYFI